MKIEQELDSFLAREKFNDTSWQERGLQPSPKEKVDLMISTIDEITNDVKDAYWRKESKNSIKRIITTKIKNLQDEGVFDTEERDFLVDLIFELAAIVNLKIEGSTNDSLSNQDVIGHIKQKCDKCKVYLNTWIKSKTDKINYFAWDIVKCNNCGELNILSLDPYTKKCVGEGYEFVKQLDKNKYDEETARVILKKMRNQTGH